MSAPDPAAMMAAVAQRKADLLAQCRHTPSPMPDEQRAANPINVIELGNDGPIVLIVHGGIQGGLGGGPSTFDQQRLLAERGWRLRLVERPGFGRTVSRGADDMEADAEWIADMLVDGAHLVGHSWGGAEALLAAARRPNAVRSLTLIEPALFPIVMTDADLRADPAMQAVGARLAQLMLQSPTPADYAIGFARAMLGPPENPEAMARVAALERDRDTATAVGCALLHSRMASGETMRAAAETVATQDVPTLVISGGWSPFFDVIGEVVARFTRGRYKIVPATGHMVQEAGAALFNPVLEEFMRKAEAEYPHLPR